MQDVKVEQLSTSEN